MFAFHKKNKVLDELQLYFFLIKTYPLKINDSGTRQLRIMTFPHQLCLGTMIKQFVFSK